MSRIAEIIYSIQEDLDYGYLSFGAIAEKHSVTRKFVQEIYDDYVEKRIDCDDGYSLASAGFGTDEDYACYGMEDC